MDTGTVGFVGFPPTLTQTRNRRPGAIMKVRVQHIGEEGVTVTVTETDLEGAPIAGGLSQDLNAPGDTIEADIPVGHTLTVGDPRG